MPPTLAPHTLFSTVAGWITVGCVVAASAVGPNPPVTAATPVKTVATRNDFFISYSFAARSVDSPTFTHVMHHNGSVIHQRICTANGAPSLSRATLMNFLVWTRWRPVRPAGSCRSVGHEVTCPAAASPAGEI